MAELARARAKLTQAEGDLTHLAQKAAAGNERAEAMITTARETRDALRAEVDRLEALQPEPTPAPVVVPVESAIVELARAKKFRAADVGFGHGSAARIKMSVPLGPDALARAYRLLASYRAELAAVGIEYESIPAPPAVGPGGGGGQQRPAGRKPIGRSRVWVDAKGLWLKSPYEARELVQTRILSARWQKSRVAYLLPATPQAALSIADALGQYGIDADAAATELVKAGHAAKGAQGKRVALDLPPVPGSKTDAWTHQRQAFWFARELPGVILDMEMGTGKSKVVCDLIHDSRAESALIVCPERVVGVWPKQFGIHCGGDKHIIDPRRQNRRGEWELLPIAKRVELYEHALHECDCGLPHVLISNYSAAAHEPFKSWSLLQHFDYIAYDESHRIRSHSGVWSKWAAKMHAHADRRLGGTGTMQAQTPLDVFGQARAIEPGVFGNTFTGFKNRYAIMGGFEGREFQGMNPATEDEFVARLASFTYRAGEEVLDLPEMLPEVTVEGRLSPKAWKAYRDLEDDMYAEVRRTVEAGIDVTDEVSAPNVLVKILRCQQLTGGALPLDSGEVLEIDTGKADLLADELEDIAASEPVVVFARFHHDLDKIQQVAEKLGRPYGELSGRRSDALASDATLAEGVQVAGVQIQAGGTGVDFTRSAFGVYYSVGHSLADYLQSRKRLQRPGQTRSVRFRHLVMSGTIDEDVYEALANRQSVTDRIAGKVLRLQRGA